MATTSDDAGLIRITLTAKQEKKAEEKALIEVTEAGQLQQPPRIQISDLSASAHRHGELDACLSHGTDYLLPRGLDYLSVEPVFKQRPRELLPWPFLKYLRYRASSTFSMRSFLTVFFFSIPKQYSWFENCKDFLVIYPNLIPFQRLSGADRRHSAAVGAVRVS